MAIFFHCLCRKKALRNLWNRGESLIDKECDVIRILKTVRIMKTILKRNMSTWKKFKHYLNQNAYKRVIDCDIADIRHSKFHARKLKYGKVEDHVF
jgi:hypothetical protein